jgi:hypothetical protein
VFWDWKTGKIASRLRAHKEVVIDHAWLPNEHVSSVCCEIHGNGADKFSQRSSLLRGMVRSSCGHSRIAACISLYLALDSIISLRCCVHLVNETEAY